MGKPVFIKSKRYVDKKGRTFGKGVWYDSNGKLIKPGQGVYNKNTQKVTQYNSDGSISVFTREQWHNKKVKEHEVRVLQNDRKWAIPYIPEKKMTITIDKNSPTSRNRGATFSENVLDSIAVNAQRAGIPFSTGLALASTESTIGSNKERTYNNSLLPWLYALNQDNGKYGNYARGISYDEMYSPTALISNWTQSKENPFTAYVYDAQGNLRIKSQNEDYYEKDFYPSIIKDNNYVFDNKSPLQSGFELYKRNPQRYNGNDKDYSSKVEANRRELVNYSPEIKEYMRKNNLHGEGGPLTLNKTWDNLSLAEKAEMMRVAINNGILTLPEIKNAYNEYAQGGPLKGWTVEDEAGYRHWRNSLPKNLRDTNDADYDMRAAYKAGMQPEWNDKDKSYHLGSRDPKTGRILKAPHHLTYLQALATDAALGYYPTMDSEGNTYTETWKGNEEVQNMLNNEYAEGGNLYRKGGYAPSKKLQNDIATWEGTEMKRNAPFSEVTKQFNAVIPKNIQARLSTDQLDALYSYGYNVGMGNLKKRVVPTLSAYVNNKASREDVQKSMWASKDNELRGLTRRRNWERAKFGGGYRTTFTGKGGNPNNNGRINLGLQTDPASYGIPDTFFNDFTKQIYTVPSPSVQYADSMQIDPSTVYTPPVIVDTPQNTPEIKEEEPEYNPKQDRLEGLRRLSSIMDMMGQSNPLSGFLGSSTPDNSPLGIMAMVNGIYGK